MATARKDKVASSECLETLSPEFFLRDTVTVARALLGVTLLRRLEDGTVLAGPIVETEAYTQDDPACHAFRGKTPRCSVMFGPGGFAYVYFIYGMYNCLNVVTEVEHTAGAVLIRAVGAQGTNGPGKLCREWGIDRSLNGVNLMDPGSRLWLAKGDPALVQEIEVTTRIGLSVAQDRPWRFTIRDHPSVSAGGSRRNSKPRESRTAKAGRVKKGDVW